MTWLISLGAIALILWGHKRTAQTLPVIGERLERWEEDSYRQSCCDASEAYYGTSYMGCGPVRQIGDRVIEARERRVEAMNQKRRQNVREIVKARYSA